jgi:hypothetical protein
MPAYKKIKPVAPKNDAPVVLNRERERERVVKKLVFRLELSARGLALSGRSALAPHKMGIGARTRFWIHHLEEPGKNRPCGQAPVCRRRKTSLQRKRTAWGGP